jgi:hypothetical protein
MFSLDKLTDKIQPLIDYQKNNQTISIIALRFNALLTESPVLALSDAGIRSVAEKAINEGKIMSEELKKAGVT